MSLSGTPFQALRYSKIDLAKFNVGRDQKGMPILLAPSDIELKLVPTLSDDKNGVRAYDVWLKRDDRDRHGLVFLYPKDQKEGLEVARSLETLLEDKSISAETPHLGLPLYYSANGCTVSLRESNSVVELIKELPVSKELERLQRAYIVYQILLAVSALHKSDFVFKEGGINLFDFVAYDLGGNCLDPIARYYIEFPIGNRSNLIKLDYRHQDVSDPRSPSLDNLKASNCRELGKVLEDGFPEQSGLIRWLRSCYPADALVQEPHPEVMIIQKIIDAYNREYRFFEKIAFQHAKIKEGLVTKKSRKEVAREADIQSKRLALRTALGQLKGNLDSQGVGEGNQSYLLFQKMEASQDAIPPRDLDLATDVVGKLRLVVIHPRERQLNINLLEVLKKVLPKPAPWFKRAGAVGLCFLGVALLAGAATLTILTGGLASPVLIAASLLADQLIAAAGYVLGVGAILGGIGLFKTCKPKKGRLTEEIVEQAQQLRSALA